MSVVLTAIGAVCVVLGLALAGFGIPVKEFSFGNTLIVAGVTMAMGGLVLVGLAAIVSQLQRVAEILAVRPPARSAQPFEGAVRPPQPFETPAPAPVSGAMPKPYPPRPRPADTGSRDPHPFEQRLAAMVQPPMPEFDDRFEPAPMMRNPEEVPAASEEFDEAPLSPREAPVAPRMPMPEFAEQARSVSAPPVAEKRDPMADTMPRQPAPSRPSSPNYFDTMWPAESRAPRADRLDEPKAKPEPAAREPQSAPAMRFEAEVPRRRPATEAVRTTSILKSGVVDGMGYTLYVDGSIEAELPNGMVRFASINELRAHLEKNS